MRSPHSTTNTCAAIQQGAASGTALQPLPQHCFSPHDVVALRPAKGDANAPAVTSGVVYRLKETAVIIAVDDAPEDGLDQPLRLDKLANDVRFPVPYFSHAIKFACESRCRRLQMFCTHAVCQQTST